MATAATTGGKKALHRRRIIERPRLIALLDESTAQVRTLVAPAGYGKTTLAEQWVEKEGRRGTWFTARPSSTDVAALALGLAGAATEIVPDCDARLREHLRALPAPAERVDVLAELLGEELESWPQDAWLVLDDYHELSATADAERLVEELVAVAPIQLLIASRQRASWITARRILYGEVLELNQTELAMDGHEAAEVLSERNAASASGLVALANGWPAVIGLASVSTAEFQDQVSVPESLYQFFAEEVFSALDPDVRVGLATLAIAPVIDRALASILLGEDAERICSAALDVGILVERGVRLDLHPLARAFLEERRDQGGIAPATSQVQECLKYFHERHDWDAAFDLIIRLARPNDLESLLEDALDELLETARLSTIDSWCDHAQHPGSEGAIFSLSRAEVALRRGQLVAAQAFAESVASKSSLHELRALTVAGRAAHLASREDEALELYRRAEASATSEELRREARWGQLACLTDLEMPEAISGLDELAAGIGLDDPRGVVRAAGQRLYSQSRFGGLNLTDADRAFEVLPVVNDPLVESSFLSVYSTALASSARYKDAQTAAERLLTMARRYRLDFALPYGLAAAGMAEAGLRNWTEADRYLSAGVEEARSASNIHGELHCLAAQVRTLAQQGRFDDSLALADVDLLQSALPVPMHMRAEFVATRAFVHVAAGRVDAALGFIRPYRGATRAIEPCVLVAAVDAIASFRRHKSDVIDQVNRLSELALATGGLDILVTTYRAVPEVLAILLRSQAETRFRDLVYRAGDEDLLGALGHGSSHGSRDRGRLTARELEVYDLLRQGLTNREIATLLVIAEGTAKLHVQHVFDKLGVRSRKAIAIQAALERSVQATSAIEETGAATDS